MDGSQWMVYQNTVTGVLHWDFVRVSSLGWYPHVKLTYVCQSTEGRFISFPVIDSQCVFESFVYVHAS